MVRSWDCFDTLLARKYHYPKSIFSILENRYNDSNFYNLRINAERQAAKKTLDDIYELLPNYSAEDEFETEKEYTFPIIENFQQINDGDIIVSDMYLSDKQILSLLRHHGLNKDVTVYSSYGGKVSGKIWDSIKSKHNIDYHIGDNLYSDIILPRKYGIKTQYYHNSNLSYHELLIERYLPYLAYWAKYTRLNNPYLSNNQSFIFNNGSLSHFCGTEWIYEEKGSYEIYRLNKLYDNKLELYSKKLNDTILIDKPHCYKNNARLDTYVTAGSNSMREDQRILWTEQAIFNIPILLSTIYALPKKQNIVFTYRDCVYMKMLYDSIFETNSDMLHTSRAAYYYPYNEEYIVYLKNTIKNSLVVDLHGTGASSQSCFKSLGTNDTNSIFVCEHCDNHQKNMSIKNLSICFHQNLKENINNTRFNHNKKASMMGLKCCRGTVLEKFNISPDMGALVGWVDNKPYRRRCEHDKIICETFHKCVQSACGVSKYYKDLIRFDNELLDLLLDAMYNDTYTNSVVHSLWDKK